MVFASHSCSLSWFPHNFHIVDNLNVLFLVVSHIRRILPCWEWTDFFHFLKQLLVVGNPAGSFWVQSALQYQTSVARAYVACDLKEYVYHAEALFSK